VAGESTSGGPTPGFGLGMGSDGVKFFENNTDKKSGFQGPKCFTDQMIKGAKDR